MQTQEVSRAKLISVTVGCFFLMISSSVVSNSQGYFLTTVRDYLGCTAAQFSLYYTCVQLSTVFTCLCLGFLMNKVHRKYFITVGAIGVILGFLVLSRTESLAMLYAGAVLVGLFQALIVVPPVQILNAWNPNGAGISMGVVMSATGFGGIIMAQVMPRLVANVSWRTGYVFCAVMYAVCTAIGIFLVKDDSPSEIEARQLAASGQTSTKKEDKFSSVATNIMFWVFIALCFIGNGASNIDQHLSPIMQTKGLDAAGIANMMTIFNIALLIWKISEGWFYQKAGGKRFVLIYAVVGILGYLLLQLNGGMFAVAIIAKAFTGAGITVVYSLVCNDFFGTKFGGLVWSYAWASFQFGASVFSPIYGSFLDRYGSYDRATYIGAVVNLVVGLVFFWMLSHKKQEEPAAAEAEA